ncbi:MAG: hypothetical protein LBE83_05780 [Propionibacteriaceae bacterium]|jgi:hypothetical protein|nr:hypothetical protein [Propionibacteriaceae bacterium]
MTILSRSRLLVAALSVLCSAGLIFGSTTPSHADEPDALRNLALAEAAYDAAQAAWQQAQAAVAQAAIDLYNAEEALKVAQARAAINQASIDRQQDAINAYARSVVQDSLPLVRLAVLMNAETTANLANRVQWNDTVLAINQVNLNELRQIQASLNLAKIQAETAKVAAEQAKTKADAELVIAQAAREEAERTRAAMLAALEAYQDIVGPTPGPSGPGGNSSPTTPMPPKPTPTPSPSPKPTPSPSPSPTPTPTPTPTPPPSTDLTPAQAKAAAKGMVAAYGWNDAQYQCLVWLWERESNWRWWAENPYSGAYGIPQSLPANKMASAGSDWKTNAITQMRWGLDYIWWRYDAPCGAWDHSEQVNWY